MSELKKYWPTFFIGLIVIITAGYIAWTSGYVAQTGTLGDTLGGIFSPIVGLFSAVLIYETFKAQRDQLKDQQDANAYSRSSFFYNELMQLQKNVIDRKNGFYFRGQLPQLREYDGMEAVENFVLQHKNYPRYEIKISGLQLIGSVLSQLSLLLSIAERAKKERGLLIDEELRLLMYDHIKGLLYNLTQNYDDMFDVVRSRLTHLKSEGNAEEDTYTYSNELMRQFQSYIRIMKSFETLGYIEKYQIQIVSSDEFFDKALDREFNTIDLESRFVISKSSNTKSNQ